MSGPALVDGFGELITEAIDWRRELHRNPEVAYMERRTSDFIATQLARFGLKVHRGLAGTGVVGTLTRGTSRRTIGIRADMDALPILEESGVAHASRTAGVMHACGHDGHVAMALAAARVCARLPALDGTVHFIFQPAEENEGGGRRMIEDGLFRLFPCDAIYALHNWPGLPVGTCVVRDGAMMAALDAFEIVVTGQGCHGAIPHEGNDPIVAGSHLVCALHSVVSRNIEPAKAAVVSPTQIRAGDTWNVIPDRFVIRGTTRWFDQQVGDTLERRVRELSSSIAGAFGCGAQIEYHRRFPPTINDPAAAAFARSVIAESELNLTLMHAEPSMASEDFAFMLQAVPGCYLWLGGQRPGHDYGLHSPRYDFNDELLPFGVGVWVALVHESLLAG